MAAKRMFSIDVIDTDKFLDMPVTTQALYFHLGMRADDDGFVSSPKKVIKIANCTNDDMRILISKGYVISFESGVIVITDWKVNNWVKGDRYKPTKCQEEKELLEVCNDSYVIKNIGIPSDNQLGPNWNQSGTTMEPQVRLGKVRLGKDSIDGEINTETEVSELPVPKKKMAPRFIPPTAEEVREYCVGHNYSVDPQRFVDFYECKGWMVGKNKMKDWKAAVRTWVRRDQKEVIKDEPEPTNSVRLW